MSLEIYGGPANGKTFSCSRAPQLLRVVCTPPAKTSAAQLELAGVDERYDAPGAWDCLDQLVDEPQPQELIYLYEQISYQGTVHICAIPRRNSGWWAMGTYRFIVAAPPASKLDQLLRDTTSWRAFVAAYFGNELNAYGEPTNVVELASRRTA